MFDPYGEGRFLQRVAARAGRIGKSGSFRHLLSRSLIRRPLSLLGFPLNTTVFLKDLDHQVERGRSSKRAAGPIIRPEEIYRFSRPLP